MFLYLVQSAFFRSHYDLRISTTSLYKKSIKSEYSETSSIFGRNLQFEFEDCRCAHWWRFLENFLLISINWLSIMPKHKGSTFMTFLTLYFNNSDIRLEWMKYKILWLRFYELYCLFYTHSQTYTKKKNTKKGDFFND